MCLPGQQKLAKEEAIVDCVTFFTRRELRRNNFERKYVKMESEKGQKRNLQKLKDSKRYEGFRQFNASP